MIESETKETNENAYVIMEEISKLQNDIDLLKQMLESLSSISSSEQTLRIT